MLDLAAIRPGDHVLDVACGTGLVTFRAAELTGPQGRVEAHDISEKMVQHGRQRAQEAGLPNVTFQRAEAENPGVGDGTFDVALNALGLMYVPEPARAVAEMWRILKPGGRAAAAVWGRRDRCGWAAIFPIVDKRVESDVCPLFFRLGTGQTLEQTFQGGKFDRVVTDRIHTVLHYSSAEQALIASFTGGPVALAYSRFDERTRQETHAEYLESIAEYRRPDGRYEIPGEFVIAAGCKK
jgi:ubiquinone/menaquinone biosynthesis C-methylase UbiE